MLPVVSPSVTAPVPSVVPTVACCASRRPALIWTPNRVVPLLANVLPTFVKVSCEVVLFWMTPVTFEPI